MPGGSPFEGVRPCLVDFTRRNSPRLLRSENHLSCEPEGALSSEVTGFARELGSAGSRRDDSEIRAIRRRKGCVRVAEIRRVGNGERVYSELETHPLGDPEVSQETSVQIKEARPAKD